MYLPSGRSKVTILQKIEMNDEIQPGIYLHILFNACMDVHKCWFVEKEKEYVCQVFCHEDSTNQWRFVFAFVESKYLNVSQ